MIETWEEVRRQENQLDAEVSALMLLWQGLLPAESCPSSTELLEWRRKFSYAAMTKAINSAHEWCRTHRHLTHRQIARTANAYMVNRTKKERTQ